jgi:putative peptidoglycan lipid II flippase
LPPRPLSASTPFGLPGYIIAKALQAGYFARRDIRTPFQIALLGVAADFAVAIALFATWSQVGIAAAAAIAGWFNAVALAVVLWRRQQLAFDRPMMVRVLLLVISAVAMGAILFACAQALAPFLAAARPLPVKASALATLGCIGLATYLVIAWLIGAIEPR